MLQPDDRLAGFTAAVRDLFPPQVSVAAVDPRDPQPALFPEEAPAMANAVETRRREFAAGRAAARQALARLGLSSQAVPMGADRAPIWPEGVVGSISHTATHCAAIVASAQHVRSVGLDLEPDTPLDHDLWPEICTPAETAWLAAQPELSRGRLAKLIFSAKECAFKCQYPVTGTFLDFQVACVELNQEDGTVEVRFDQGILPAHADGVRGRYRRESDLLLVGMVLPRPAGKAA